MLFFFECYGDHRDLHSFPTRRSSDLRHRPMSSWIRPAASIPLPKRPGKRASPVGRAATPGTRVMGAPAERSCRSEEHTSELQSRLHLVCRLLLEKKNNKTSIYFRHHE